jgi:hypothetical protein
LVHRLYSLDYALSDRERVENRGFTIRIAIAYLTRQNGTPKTVGCAYPRPSRFNHWRACNGIRANSNNPKSLKYPYGIAHKT